MAEPENLSELIDETSVALTLLIERIAESQQHVEEIGISAADSWKSVETNLVAADEQLTALDTAMENVHSFLDTHAEVEKGRFDDLAEALQMIEVTLAETGKRIESDEQILAERFTDMQTNLGSTLAGWTEAANHYTTDLRQVSETMSNMEETLAEAAESLDEELADAKTGVTEDIEKIIAEISDTDETIKAATASIIEAIDELVTPALESAESFKAEFKELSGSVFDDIEEKFEEGFEESLEQLGDGVGGALAIVDQAMQTKVTENEEAMAALEKAVDDCSATAKAACDHVQDAFSHWERHV
ncbi:MAG: hypothetical protein ACR2IE_04965 [Candidatus Sumerlaeaceae bacterium]